jgi:palmitoyltransferase
MYPVEVIAPDLPYPLITIPLCLLIAANLLAHYYYVCTTRPGTPSDGLGTAEGRGWSWAPKRRGGGVQWSPVNLTDPTGGRAAPRCNKCHGPKPDVSYFTLMISPIGLTSPSERTTAVSTA